MPKLFFCCSLLLLSTYCTQFNAGVPVGAELELIFGLWMIQKFLACADCLSCHLTCTSTYIALFILTRERSLHSLVDSIWNLYKMSGFHPLFHGFHINYFLAKSSAIFSFYASTLHCSTEFRWTPLDSRWTPPEPFLNLYIYTKYTWSPGELDLNSK